MTTPLSTPETRTPQAENPLQKLRESIPEQLEKGNPLTGERLKVNVELGLKLAAFGEEMAQITKIEDSEERAQKLAALQREYPAESLQKMRQVFYQENKIKDILRQPAEMILGSVAVMEQNEQGELWYRADFPQAVRVAERKIGLGDLLPRDVTWVEVEKEDGSRQIGFRTRLEFRGIMREGYRDVQTGKYITILDGDRFREYVRNPEKAKPASVKNLSEALPSAAAVPEETWQFTPEKDENSFANNFANVSREEAQNIYLEFMETNDAVTNFFSSWMQGSDLGFEEALQIFATQTLGNVNSQSREDITKKIRDTFERYKNFFENKGSDLLFDPDFDVLELRDTLGEEGLAEFLEATGLAKQEDSAVIKAAIESGVNDEDVFSDSDPILQIFIREFGADNARAALAKYIITLAKKESSFRPFALSETYCMGPFQFTRRNTERYKIRNPFHIKSALQGLHDLWADNVFSGAGSSKDLVMAHFIGVGRVIRGDVDSRNTRHASNHESGNRYHQNLLKVLYEEYPELAR